MKHQFFQTFFGPQQINTQQSQPEYITHNEVVLEIVNNWEHVLNLINRYNTGTLEKVDQLEHVWYNFIIGKNIDITNYKNEEEFFSTFWKTPEK